MGNLDTLQIEGKEIKVVGMKGVHVIAPFFLACSHYETRRAKESFACDKGVNLLDDRICCKCDFYDGGSIIALEWEGETNFMIYPFKNQYTSEQIKNLMNRPIR